MKRIIFLIITTFVWLNAQNELEIYCKKGNPKACHNLAVNYLNGIEGDQNLSQAYTLFKKACDDKFLKSCYNLALMSESGIGTNPDEFIAFENYQKTCVLSKKKTYEESIGCASLAKMYMDGRGTRQDTKKGLEILNDTCKKGVLENCTILAEIYQNGYSLVPKDINKTKEILEYACKKDSSKSCVSLSEIYLNSSEKKGVEFLKEACKLKDDESCLKIAIFYTNGEFVDQNLSIAKEFFGKACDLKNSTGCQSYKLLNEEGIR